MGQLGNMFVSSLRRAERCVHHFLGEQLQLGEHCNTSVLRGAVDPNGFSSRCFDIISIMRNVEGVSLRSWLIVVTCETPCSTQSNASKNSAGIYLVACFLLRPPDVCNVFGPRESRLSCNIT